MTGFPFDHSYFFSVIVTVLPSSENTGGLAIHRG